MASNQPINHITDENDGYENSCSSTSLKKLYLNRKTADVHFEFDVNGICERVPAHKAILAANSDSFDAMFYGLLPEGSLVKIFA